jgi:hypothetical protein
VRQHFEYVCSFKYQSLNHGYSVQCKESIDALMRKLDEQQFMSSEGESSMMHTLHADADRLTAERLAAFSRFDLILVLSFVLTGCYLADHKHFIISWNERELTVARELKGTQLTRSFRGEY